jgi:hypothetical protein
VQTLLGWKYEEAFEESQKVSILFFPQKHSNPEFIGEP